MDFMFSTEDFELIATSTDHVIIEGRAAPVSLSKLSPISEQSYLFLEIPPLHLLVIAICQILISIILNFFVLRYYWRVRDSTRPYILSLVALDSFTMLFALLPMSLVFYMRSEAQASFIILNFTNSFTRFVSITYLYPSLFLALDRFLAVQYPHKFRVLAPKLKRVKLAFVLCTFVYGIITGVLQMFFSVNSLMYVIGGSLNILVILSQLLGSIVLYSLTAYRVLKSGRKMAENRHGTSENSG